MDCANIVSTLKFIAKNYRPGTLKGMEMNPEIWTQLTYLENEINQATLKRDKERLSRACQSYGLLIMVNTVFKGSLLEQDAEATPQSTKARPDTGERQEQNMKVSRMFPSKYLSKDDLSKPEVFRIETVEMDLVQNEDGKEEKPILYFADNKGKPLILNKTNAEILAGEFGPDSEDWAGQEIELYVDPSIRFGKQKIGGIRVRIPDTSTKEAVTLKF